MTSNADLIPSYEAAEEKGEHTEAYGEERGGRRDDADMLAYRGHIFQLQCRLKLNR